MLPESDDLTVFDCRSAAGVLAWAETSPTPSRAAVLRVVRSNIAAGLLPPADVRALVAAGYVELES